jgi:hypothetical protein
MQTLLWLVCAMILVGWLVFDRSSFEVRVSGRPAAEAAQSALHIGLAASGVLSLTFLGLHEVDVANWALSVVLQFAVLSLVAYSAATKGASYAAGKLKLTQS